MKLILHVMIVVHMTVILVPTVVVKVSAHSEKVIDVITLSRRKLDTDDPLLRSEKAFTVKRLYSERDRGLGLGRSTRVISKVYSCQRAVKYAIIQYLGMCTTSGIAHTQNTRLNHISGQTISLERKTPFITT